MKSDPQITKTEREALVQSRIGQGVFRKSLMEKYRGSCIITKIDHPKLLVASHIKPWMVSSNSERLRTCIHSLKRRLGPASIFDYEYRF